MSRDLYVRGKTRKRVLVIHPNARVRHDLAEGWRKAGWEAFDAEGRSDGMPLVYQLRPSLINLEASSAEESNWDLPVSIRLVTNIPIILLTDQPLNLGDYPLELTKIHMVVQPMSIPKMISESIDFWRLCQKQSSSEKPAVIRTKYPGQETQNATKYSRRQRQINGT